MNVNWCPSEVSGFSGAFTLVQSPAAPGCSDSQKCNVLMFAFMNKCRSEWCDECVCSLVNGVRVK